MRGNLPHDLTSRAGQDIAAPPRSKVNAMWRDYRTYRDRHGTLARSWTLACIFVVMD